MNKRDCLTELKSDGLSNVNLQIHSAGEVRRYTLQQCVGEGKTGVTWRATDQFNQSWAVKFVVRADYKKHSIEGEVARVNQLLTKHLAKIVFYGEPKFEKDGISESEFYGVVVEWVEGVSLNEYLETSAHAISVPAFLRFARTLCEVVRDLEHNGLTHNDLHDRNIIVSPTVDPLTREKRVELMVIDTGGLKTEERRLALVEEWQAQIEQLKEAEADNKTDLSQSIERLRRWVNWFSRTDQEWIVSHLCSLFNCFVRRMPDLDVCARRFLRDLPDLLDRMVDPDRSRRLHDPRDIFLKVEQLWDEALQLEQPSMTSPFDRLYAELIHSDRQLMDLFSDEFPRLAACRSVDPIYLYGPRGCGKSTVLRSLSLKAVLASEFPTETLKKTPFLGIYISCSAELRSRFWLMPEADYDELEAHIVRYFNLLLIEELVDTLDAMHVWDSNDDNSFRFGINDAVASDITSRFRNRLGISGDDGGRHVGTTPFAFLKLQVRQERDRVWHEILDRSTTRQRTDAQLLFDLCDELIAACPALDEQTFVFLLDDYSNQRIPVLLQRRLNQAITFAKKGRAVFKVTSEYGGVDLAGVQEGREVLELNVGLEYVALTDQHRWRFLRQVLEKRFEYMGAPVNILDVLPVSNVGTSVAMAKHISECHSSNRPFYYHGFDTISDLCSGDFAMGLDLVRRVFEQGTINWRSPRPVASKIQDQAIERFAAHELDQVRYLAPHGREKYQIVDRLCWLAKECAVTKTTTKDGKSVPLVKIHLDIAETCLNELEANENQANAWEIFNDLITKGALFPIDTSKSRERRDGTRRFQLRRILLARYGAPLGRHTPIRIDRLPKLLFLINSPDEFVKSELNSDGQQGQLKFGGES